MLKARKQKTDGRASVSQDRAKNMKRYMILTYSVEYDKVHYPLPLNYEVCLNFERVFNGIKG